jgi:hypothetical protein
LRRIERLRAAEVREELPAAVDQLPAAGPQAGPAVRGRGEARRRPPCPARQQVAAIHLSSRRIIPFVVVFVR